MSVVLCLPAHFCVSTVASRGQAPHGNLLSVFELARFQTEVYTYDFSSCFFPKFKIMHFQNRAIKLYTVVLLFLCFLKLLLKLCCR